MWCVAELNEDYITKMEDVLEIYERAYDPSEPVVCLDESPSHCTPMFAPLHRPNRDARPDKIMSTSAAAPPTSSAL
jgi:hypothetical protein